MSYLQVLKKDKKLTEILSDDAFELALHPNIPLRLMHAIMSQQLSTKVADVFRKRFQELFPHANPTAREVLQVPYETLRSIGLSHAKATYVHNVATFCVAHRITDKKLLAMSNEEVISLLTEIKGVGRWTVEMLLMFSLGREDVFPVDDLGIQQAMIKLYRLRTTEKKALQQKLQRIAAKWSPYRTYACMHLWAWKDGGPFE
jgi:DNA-3-methyladenine glycosylase II